MKTHELKLLSQYFNSVEDGSKPFEIRFDDRNYQVGDILVLKETENKPHKSALGNFLLAEYTGREIKKEISYKLKDFEAGLKEGWCVLGLKNIEPQKVWVHFARFKDMEHINKIPFPEVFSTYENLTKYEEWLNNRKDIEVLQVEACVIDDGMKRIESEE